MSRMTVAQQNAEAKRRADRARSAGLCRELGIRNIDIAASCRPPVKPPTVSKWFAALTDSSNIERTVNRLIGRARQRVAGWR